MQGQASAVRHQPGQRRRDVEPVGSGFAPTVTVLDARVESIEDLVAATHRTGRSTGDLVRIEPAAAVAEVVRPHCLRLLSDDVDGSAHCAATVEHGTGSL